MISDEALALGLFKRANALSGIGKYLDDVIVLGMRAHAARHQEPLSDEPKSYFGSSGERLASKVGRRNQKMRRMWARVKLGAVSPSEMGKHLLDRAQERVRWFGRHPGAAASIAVGGAGLAVGLRYLDRYQDRTLRGAPDEEATR